MAIFGNSKLDIVGAEMCLLGLEVEGALDVSGKSSYLISFDLDRSGAVFSEASRERDRSLGPNSYGHVREVDIQRIGLCVIRGISK